MSIRATVINEIVAPLARRIGTASAAALAALGAETGLLLQVEAGIAAALLVSLDLVWSHFERKARRA